MRRSRLVSVAVLFVCACGANGLASGSALESDSAPTGTPASVPGTLMAAESGMMPTTPDGWRAFSPRPESAAVTSIEPGPDGYVLKAAAVSFDRTLQAPAGTTGADVELVLQWAADGRVAFDKLNLVPAEAPAARKVRVAAVHYRPSGSRSGLESVQKAVAYAGQVASTDHPDVFVLGELLNIIGAPGPFESKAEPIPGPSTETVAAVARAQQVNIVFGMLEKEGSQLFNTAVLIDRSGNIVGKHRKVQLPLSDAAIGITPGSAVAVFDAELLLVPIWGGKTTLLHARAIENGLHLAAAGYDYASEIVNPLGKVLSTVVVDGAPHAAIADIELSQRFREDYLGNWRDISAKERRTAPYQYRMP